MLLGKAVAYGVFLSGFEAGRSELRNHYTVAPQSMSLVALPLDAGRRKPSRLTLESGLAKRLSQLHSIMLLGYLLESRRLPRRTCREAA
jgi:hypothetical protein